MENTSLVNGWIKSVLSLVIAIVLIGGTIALAFFFPTKIFTPVKSTAVIPSVIPSPSISPSGSPVYHSEFTNQSLYRNYKYHAEFWYPRDKRLEEIEISKDSETLIKIYQPVNDKNTEWGNFTMSRNRVDADYTGLVESTHSAWFGAYEWKIVTYKEDPQELYLYFRSDNDTMYIFTFPYIQSIGAMSKEQKDMVSSFRVMEK